MIILGINAYHGDSSACILKNGELIAAVEEERFVREKHWAGFPKNAIQYCLKEANVTLDDISHIALNRNPKANLVQKFIYLLRRRPRIQMIKDRFSNTLKIGSIAEVFKQEFGIKPNAKFHFVEHHIAHLSSAFMVSPFDTAAVVSVDGFGDFVGTMWGIGNNNKLLIKDRIFFPHSLGLLYLAITQYLGFPNYGDEYKVMGLAAYGKPILVDKMKDLVHIKTEGRFELNLKYFTHHVQGATMTWNGKPTMEPVFSNALETLLGKTRKEGEAIESLHENIAASLQAMYEEALFHILNHVYNRTKHRNLCLAGGCGMNSVANGKIFDNTPFKDVYIQSAAGDAGGALGAAFYVWNSILRQKRQFVMNHSYWGPAFSDEVIGNIIKNRKELKNDEFSLTQFESKAELCKKTASAIASGNVVGWFQGRLEWGARALGNRSILGNPCDDNMKDILNSKIKKRESFRPFAPSILLESVATYFEKSYPDPFMIKVYPITPEKRKKIPAVTHVDGTGRLQTVSKKDNPLYWQLISELKNITGVPIVLNTSFNENEPIVCNPSEALDCFFRTKMDVLVLGSYYLKRNEMR